MCGLYGKVVREGIIQFEDLARRSDLLKHRGPDESGIWSSPSARVGLAHRRLAIIDLSQSAHQPMFSDDGKCAVVFNGELYNFKILRAELERKGLRFRSVSDTEVVLNSYLAWGERCIEQFNGMFAFAIYDERPSRKGPMLFLARDRVGKKPLYYAHHADRFEFASELKALDAHGELDSRALNFYLALGYVPGDQCLARGVKKLPPAHAARLDLQSHKLDVWKYWELPENGADRNVDGEVLADKAQELFADAVGLRLVSDVPLGVLLSGGLDSSLIVGAAAQKSSKPIKTFTIAFPGSRFDESAHAQRVADYFDTDHHVLEVPHPSLGIVDELAPLIDEPIADSSLVPTFLVSRLTRHHVTVALGGDGGDELFGGYTDYTTSLADERRVGWLPKSVLSRFADMAARLPAGVRGRNRLASWRGGPLQQMIWGRPYFDVELRRRILQKEFWQTGEFSIDEPEKWLLSLYGDGRDPIDCMTRTHFGSILPDDFLVKVDRASMAVGLEMRAPFLDYRLVEFAFGQIPSYWKVADGEARRVERLLARRMLPPQADIDRKQGFSIPLDEWLRADGCAGARRHFHHLPEAIDTAAAEKLIVGHMRGRTNGARLYSLMMLGIAAKNNGWH